MTHTDFAFLLEISRLGWPLAVLRWRLHFDAEWAGW
jgi:hypothetical protein